MGCWGDGVMGCLRWPAGFLIQADLLPALGRQVCNTPSILDQKACWAERSMHRLAARTARRMLAVQRG